KTIAQKFGKAYLPETPVTYKTKSKNAQEAHECIRPTDFALDPDRIGRALDEDQRKLYGLIWQRALAAGMTPARFEQTAVDIEDATKQHRWHVTGSVQLFDGFLRLYQEQEHEHESKEGKDGKDTGAGKETGAVQTDKRLPPLKAKQEVSPKSTLPERHETQPPPRFTEASLVKKMESLSIGRPSTYASIMKLLQDRNYVTLDRKRFVATTQGHLVTTFLKSFFAQYVDVHFSAQMEDSLDSVACGDMVWLQLMRTFWKDFHQRVNEVAGMEHATIRGELDRALREVLLGSAAESAPTTCPRCKNGTLSLGISKYGVFLGCSGYPECEYKLPLQEPTRATEGGAVLEVQDSAYPIQLGVDQGLPVSIRQGPYGLYFQRGETQKGSKVKPARAAIPEGIDPTLLGLDQALRYLSLPRTIGQYPETGENIIANRGPYGPYINCGYLNAKLENDDEVFSIGINRAIDLIASRPKRGEVLGKHPATGLDVVKLRSRFGTDVASGEFRARIPRGTTEEVTLDMALALLAKKAGNGKKKAPAKKAETTKKAPAKKAETTKKAPAKKGTSAHARQAR
nr:topoisomerase DNA-binding C4 zinc finger domain-containing protein [Actinomycetes bacterium]